MHVLRLALRVPWFFWRQRRSVAVAVMVAPFALTGSLELFAVNGLAMGYVAFTVLRLTQPARRKR